MNTEPVRCGILGLGRAGWSLHVETLRERHDAVIVAVADPLAERGAEAREQLGCRVHRTLGSMLRQDDVEVVVVATPSACHGRDSRKALRASKHVVVEKPMAVSLREADGMIETAEHAGRKLFVHQNYRYSKLFVHLKQAIREGLLGPLYHVRHYDASFMRRNDWQTLARNGGGVLNNKCPHDLDILLQLVDSPVRQVMGDLRRIASAGDVEDHVKAFMRTDSGCTIDMEVASAQNISENIPRWILCGPYGTLTCDGARSVIRWFDPAEAPPLEAVDGAAPDRSYANADKLPWQEKVVDIEADTPEPGNFYDNLVGVLRHGEPMAITPQSVRENLRVMNLIRKGTQFPRGSKR